MKEDAGIAEAAVGSAGLIMKQGSSSVTAHNDRMIPAAAVSVDYISFFFFFHL